jgi:hypothetical protein
MSFILDALKKLEQKRQQGTVPDLMTIHATERQKHEKRVIWPYLVAGAFILNAGILAAVFHPWEAKDQKPPTQASAEARQKNVPVMSGQQDVKSNASASASSHFTEGPVVPDKKTVAKKIIKDPGTIIAKTKIETNIPKHENSPLPVEEQIKAPVQTEGPHAHNKQYSHEDTSAALRMETTPQEMEVLRKKIKEETSHPGSVPLPKDRPVKNVEAASDEQVPDFSQLPEETRKGLPAITISAHIYSNNPRSRIVNINGSTLKEGDQVTRGLNVREITMNGVIFDYQGIRFQVRAF